MLGTNWYECKVEGEKIGENGPQKSKPESYLVDAMTFTDAEARIKIQLFHFFSHCCPLKIAKRSLK